MNFSVTNNRLKLSNGYDVSGSINSTSLLVGTNIGINPTYVLDVSSNNVNTAKINNIFYLDGSNNRLSVGLDFSNPVYTFDISGETRIQTNNIRMGRNAGEINQGINTIAIGTQAGYQNQGNNSIAIGNQAGYQDQSNNTICIGYGTNAQYSNSIVLNADTNSLSSDGSQRCFINPIRNYPSDNSIGYNSTTKELNYEIPYSINYQYLNPSTLLEYAPNNNTTTQTLFKGAYQSAVIYDGAYEWEMYINIYNMTTATGRIFYLNLQIGNGTVSRGGWYAFNDNTANNTPTPSTINNWQFTIMNPITSTTPYNTEIVISPTVTSSSDIIYAKGFFQFSSTSGGKGTFTPNFRVSATSPGSGAKMNAGNYLRVRRVGGPFLTGDRVIGEWT